MSNFTAATDLYTPLYTNANGQRYVLEFKQFFGLAEAYGSSNDVFLTERFYMGGSNLRGFDFRGAGPTQFDQPVGGEATYTATLELSFPLVATRLERDLRDRELIRGVAFFDFGLLGLSITDPTFREPRLSYGFGLRIEVPVLEIPIALDLAWPILYEETDDRQQFYFSIAR
jgi:outer membrane protein insertion porin family